MQQRIITGGNFFEFFCIPTSGNNTFAGSTPSPPVLIASGCGWNSGTATTSAYVSFTGTQDLTVVIPGMIGALSTGTNGNKPDHVRLLGIITGVDNSLKRLYVHTVQTIGRVQTISGAAVKFVVGGPWKGMGPTGGRQDAGFPLNFMSGAFRPSGGELIRINLQNSMPYIMTGYSVTTFQRGPVVVQGYTNVPGDTGRCQIISSGTNIFNMNSNGWVFINCEFYNTSLTGINNLTSSNTDLTFINCYFSGARASAISSASSLGVIECEFTDWNKAGVVAAAAITSTAGATPAIIYRSYLHDATGRDSYAVDALFGLFMHKNIIENIGGGAIRLGNNIRHAYITHNSFNNIGGDMITNIENSVTNVGYSIIEDCNFIQCSGRLLNSAGATWISPSIIRNCIYGSGYASSTSGIYNTNSLSGVLEFDIIVLPSGETPWYNPSNFDYRVVHPDAVGTARATNPSKSGTSMISYNNIGATVFPILQKGMVR